MDGDMKDDRRPHSRSLIQANGIGVTVQADHRTESLLLFICLPKQTHTFHHVICPVELLSSRNPPVDCPNTHMHIDPLRLSWSVSHLSAHLRMLITSFFFLLSRPLGLPSSRCVSLQTIWALGGLADPQPAPPWRACCLGGIQGYLVIFSVASNFG